MNFQGFSLVLAFRVYESSDESHSIQASDFDSGLHFLASLGDNNLYLLGPKQRRWKAPDDSNTKLFIHIDQFP